MNELQRNVAVFLGRICDLLCCKLLEGTDDAETCVSGLDDVVDVAVLCSVVGVAEEFVVLFFFFSENCLGIF